MLSADAPPPHLQTEPSLWGQLHATGDKTEVEARRAASVERAHAKLEAARQARLKLKEREEKVRNHGGS